MIKVPRHHKKIWYAPNQFESYNQEEIDAVNQCLKDGWLAGFGPYTVEFEKKIAERFGKKFGLFVNSGSSAILLGLASLNLPVDAEIITPACTFATTLAPIIQLGYRPVLVDVDITTYVPSVMNICNEITDQTRCILLPNLIGSKPNFDLLRDEIDQINRSYRTPETRIYIIEDSADTITHTPTSDISTTSFYASHVITAGGTGGMVMFNDEEQLRRATMVRDWGRIGNNVETVDERFATQIDGIPYDFKFLYGALGYNMRCCEMCASFGLIQLKKLEHFLEVRQTNMELYFEYLSDVKEIILPDASLLHQDLLAIPLQSENRYELLRHLEENDIQTRVCFSGNITRHPIYREYLKPFTNSDLIMKRGFLLGIHQGLEPDDVKYVCNQIRAFFNYPLISD